MVVSILWRVEKESAKTRSGKWLQLDFNENYRGPFKDPQSDDIIALMFIAFKFSQLLYFIVSYKSWIGNFMLRYDSEIWTIALTCDENVANSP